MGPANGGKGGSREETYGTGGGGAIPSNPAGARLPKRVRSLLPGWGFGSIASQENAS